MSTIHLTTILQFCSFTSTPLTCLLPAHSTPPSQTHPPLGTPAPVTPGKPTALSANLSLVLLDLQTSHSVGLQLSDGQVTQPPTHPCVPPPLALAPKAPMPHCLRYLQTVLIFPALHGAA